jgi:hypothetical protein
VIAVGASEAELERYLAAYEYRFRAACEDFDAWDDKAKDWGAEHDRMHDELLDKYQVYGSLILKTRFKIAECRSSGGPFRGEEPEPVLPPMAHTKAARKQRVADTLAWRARAVLDRSAGRNEIIAAVKAVTAGLVVVAPQLLATLLNEAPFADDLFKANGAARARLTRRELEVLVAMADGASTLEPVEFV